MLLTIISVLVYSTLLKLDVVYSACDNFKPVEFESIDSYVFKGKVAIQDGIDIYETGEDTLENGILFGITDIYGLPRANYLKQFADKLASIGYKVVIIDTFDHDQWLEANGEPRPTNLAYMEFRKNHEWSEPIQNKLLSIWSHYKNLGWDKFGIFGTLYGGTIVAGASKDMSEYFKIGAQFTTAPILLDDAYEIKIPTLVINTKLSAPFSEIDYCKIVNNNLGNNSCMSAKLDVKMYGILSKGLYFNEELFKEATENTFALFQKFLCEKF